MFGRIILVALISLGGFRVAHADNDDSDKGQSGICKHRRSSDHDDQDRNDDRDDDKNCDNSTPPVITIAPANGFSTTQSQVAITVSYSGSNLDLSTLHILLDSNEITSAFSISPSSATLPTTDPLGLGTHSITASLANKSGQSQTVNSTFAITSAAPAPTSSPGPIPTPNIDNLPGSPAQPTIVSVQLNDPASPGYGAAAIIPTSALSPNQTFTVATVDPSQIQGSTVMSAPGAMGPVIKFSPSSQFSSDVTVIVPFDVSAFYAAQIDPSQLVVIRMESTSGAYTVLQPFYVDLQHGLLYVKSNSFSWFFGGYSTSASVYNPNAPGSCIKIPGGQYCEISSSTVTITGSVTNAFNGAPSVTCSIPNCGNIKVTSLGSGSYIYSITRSLTSSLTDISFSITANSATWNFSFTYNLIPPLPLAPPPVSQCNISGQICAYAGNGLPGFSADGTSANSSKINFTSLGSPAGISHDTLGRIIWPDLTSNSGTNAQVALRRVGLTGNLETVSNFTVSGSAANPINLIGTSPLMDNLFGDILVDLNLSVGRQGLPTVQSLAQVLNGGTSYSNVGTWANVNSSTLPAFAVGANTTGNYNHVYYLQRTLGSGGGSTSLGPVIKSVQLNESSSSGQITPIATRICPNGACKSFGTTVPDGTSVVNFPLESIIAMDFYGNEIYFVDSFGNCIRKFDSSLHVITVAGLCGQWGPAGENVPALSAKLGNVQNIKLDSRGNIYFSEISTGYRIRAIRSDNHILQTVLGTTNGATSQLSIAKFPQAATSVALPNLQDFTIDLAGNLYSFGNSYIYRLAKPLPDQVDVPSTESVTAPGPTQVQLTATNLSSSTILALLNSSQNSDGFWNFGQLYYGTNLNNVALDNLNTQTALNALHSLGADASSQVTAGLTWMANQFPTSTNILSGNLKTLTQFTSQYSFFGSANAKLQNSLTGLSQNYKPPFFGWGADQFTSVNNLDTAVAMQALAQANGLNGTPSTFSVRMSDYQVVIIKLLQHQYDDRYGTAYSGGWGFYSYDNPPNLYTTVEVTRALIQYAKLPLNSYVIAPEAQSDFNKLKTINIPTAVANALSFIRQYQLPDGSFADIASTFGVNQLMDEVISSGLVPTTTVTMASNIRAAALNYANSAQLTILDMGAIPLGVRDIASINTTILVNASILPPRPQFTYQINPASRTVSFDASGSVFNGSNPTYTWSFGDQTAGSGVKTQHAYSVGGTFTVTLTVTDDRGGVGTATNTFTLPSNPIAIIQVTSASSGFAPFTANFNSSGSSDPQNLPLQYQWDFGDGTTSTSSGAVAHTYASAGQYSVTLTVTDSLSLSSTARAQITVTTPLPPLAVLTVDSSSSGPAPFTATFDALSSFDAQGLPLSFTWNFGDGATSSGAMISHAFQTPGQYTVALTVTDGANLSSTASVIINVLNQPLPPVAALSVSQGTGTAPFNTVFDSTQSYDPQGLPLTYVWDFGDATLSDANGLVPHVFTDPGQYNVTLTVTNSAGLSSSASVLVTVLAPPIPRFSFVQLNRALIESFNARTSSSPNGSITAYQWSFGDQTTGTGRSIQHTYSAAGTYSVTLTVTDVAGASAALTQQVVVAPVPTGATTISVGNSNACAIVNGGLRCLGDNSQGQVGNGLIGGLYSTAIQVVGLTNGVQAVGVGDTQACAVQNGSALCWGNGIAVPAPVPGLNSGVTAITAGSDHACAVQNSGLLCWGSNAYGQLGNGTTTDSATPTPVMGLQSGVVNVSAGRQETCALLANGSVMCWGRNDLGQLGDGTTATRTSPVQAVGLTSGVTAISESWETGCAIQNGAALCWGGDSNGQLGTSGSHLVPSQVIGLTSGVQSISAGQNTSLAVVDASAFGVQGSTIVVYWGFGNFGPGNHGGSPDNPVYAFDVPQGISAISGGGQIGCGIWGDVADCWGYQILGSIGLSNNPVDVGFSLDYTPGPLASFVFQQVWGTESVNFDASSSQPDSYYPLQSYQWNFGDKTTGSGVQVNHVYAKAGNYTVTMTVTDASGAATSTALSVAVMNPNAAGVSAISVGLTNACAIRNGSLKCLGDNTQGQVGIGSVGGLYNTAVQVTGLTSGVESVSVNDTQTCAVQNGTAMCWGIGNPLPTAVSGLSGGIQGISAGFDHACAIQNGGVLCWGSNVYGQLGNGTSTDSATPVPVIGLQSGVAAISSGHQANCALLANGAVMCWGRNDTGQLGDGTTITRMSPVQAFGLSSGVTAISMSLENGCAIQNGGALCWGGDTNGQLGTTGSPLVPSPVNGLANNVRSISSGPITTLAVTDASDFNVSGSTVIAYWGFGTFGPGNHGSSPDNPAYAFDVQQGLSAISGGGQMGCGIWNGSALCWGYQILGSNAFSNQPIDVGF